MPLVASSALAQFSPMQNNMQSFGGNAAMNMNGNMNGGGNMYNMQAQMRSVGEQPAYMTAGNGCTTVRNDNTRMQGGQLMIQGGGGQHFGG